MRLVDYYYFIGIEKVLKEGVEQEVRAKWSNGENAITKSISQLFYEFEDIKDFPITNYRRINYKKAINEILWIFQKRSNKLEDLDSKIWQSWEYKNTGTIGHIYGFITNKEYLSLENKYPSVFGDKKYLNQVEYLFQTLIDNLNDRRMMINLYDLNEVQESNLPPCAFMTQYTVIGDELHMNLIQRSGDMLTASLFSSWNTVQYAFLHRLIAKCCGLEVGKFSHFVMNSHIYDRHWKDNDLYDYIKKETCEDKVKVNIYVKHNLFENLGLTKEQKLKLAWDNFMSFKETDYEFLNYKPNDYKLKLEVAV